MDFLVQIIPLIVLASVIYLVVRRRKRAARRKASLAEPRMREQPQNWRRLPDWENPPFPTPRQPNA